MACIQSWISNGGCLRKLMRKNVAEGPAVVEREGWPASALTTPCNHGAGSWSQSRSHLRPWRRLLAVRPAGQARQTDGLDVADHQGC
ncbi:hypothetical protein KSP40_PGU021101 [Platanthera guangdongensis]|uniref:Uncharacterized protein n=1 Tax=Platanthera guangdongensis TaxID=2320717 RepID=A0ABR2M4T2_9ASPA